MKQIIYTIYSKSLNKVIQKTGLIAGRWTEDLSDAKVYTTKIVAERQLKGHKHKWDEGLDAEVVSLTLSIPGREEKLERILK